MKRYVLAGIALLLAGCATGTVPVKQVALGTYFVSTRQVWGTKTWPEMQAETMKAAGDFCAKENKTVKTVDLRTNGSRGWSPQTTSLTFECVKPTAQ